MKLNTRFCFILAALFTAEVATSAVLRIGLNGTLRAPNGMPVKKDNIEFVVEILSPNSPSSSSENCLLFKESQLADIKEDNGRFYLSLGEGLLKYNSYGETNSSKALKRAFSNVEAPLNNLVCKSGNQFTPTDGDSRFLRISFDLGDGQGLQQIETISEFKGAPFALSTHRVETFKGFQKFDFVNINKLIQATTGQILKFDGSKWSPAADNTGVTVESDPLTLSFAKSDLPNCASDSLLTSNGTSLACANDTVFTSRPDATTTSKGLIQIGDKLTISSGILSFNDNIEITGVNSLPSTIANLLVFTQFPSGSCPTYQSLRFNSLSNSFECDFIQISGTQVVGNISGTSPGFTGNLNGDVGGGQNNTVVQGLQGNPIVNSVPSIGDVLQWNGTSWVVQPDSDANGMGSVTSVTLGTGLVGGSITTSGTIDVDIGTSANKILSTDSSARVLAVDGSLLQGLNWNSFGTGSLPTSSFPSYTGDIVINSGSTTGTVKQLNQINVSTTPPNNLEILTYDTSLNSWIPATDEGGGSVSQVEAGIGLLGGVITSTGTLSLDTGTSANQIVKLDAAGRLPALDGSNLFNLNLSKINNRDIAATLPGSGSFLSWDNILQVWNGRSITSCGVSETVYYNVVTDTFPCQSISISASAVSGDISGNALNFSGSLTGDVTGLQTGTVVQSLNGRSIASTSPTSGQLLKWSGTHWEPAVDIDTSSGGTVTLVNGGTGILGGGISTSGTLSLNVGTSANQILQLDASERLPNANGSQVLAWNADNINSGIISPNRLGSGTPSSTLFLRGDGVWTNLYESGGGRTQCPSGYTLVGTLGSFSTICISTSEQPATTWQAAVAACYSQNPRAALCSAREWAMACTSNTVPAMTTGWEWVAEYGYYDAAVTMGNGACSNGTTTSNTGTYSYRCCLR